MGSASRGRGVARAREVLSKVNVRGFGCFGDFGDYREDARRSGWSRGIGGLLGGGLIASNHKTVKNNEREDDAS